MTKDQTIKVYIITNKVNGKRYIGVTKETLRARWCRHLVKANNGGDFVFCRALRKYGADNFEMKLLYEAVDRLEAIMVERALIAEYGTLAPRGYNATSGGELFFGVSVSAETRHKRRLGRLGKKHSEEAHRKLSEFRKGPGGRWSDESKAKAAQSHKGQKWTPEVRAKLEAIQATPEYRAKMRAANAKRGPVVHTEESRAKLRAANARQMTPGMRAYLAEKARNMPQEQRDKIAASVSKYMQGRTEEQKAARREKVRGKMLGNKYASREYRKNTGNGAEVT